jgi:YfiH family protein
MSLPLIIPDWPAPANVRAVSTTRLGGVSHPPFDSLNLAGHVGDAPVAVANNRARLAGALSLPASPHWLSQVHGSEVVLLEAGNEGLPEADASLTTQPAVVCAVLTADCLPVLFCDRAGSRVAIAHAGWRGLSAGVLEATVRALQLPAEDILAWLGPAIGPRAFEVGDEVRQAFCAVDANASAAFVASRSGHWHADLYQLARQRLVRAGVTAVSGGDRCTFTEVDSFYSFRRDGTTGRMASLIWLQQDSQ